MSGATGPKTIKEARALSQFEGFECFLGGGAVRGDTIIMFIDSDGERKTTRCIRRTIDGPDEWVKTPFYL